MFKYIIEVEGMACGMCEAHINEAIRNSFEVEKVSSSHTKKQTIIITESVLKQQELKNIITGAGYKAVSISYEPYEKKGLFFRKSKTKL